MMNSNASTRTSDASEDTFAINSLHNVTWRNASHKARIIEKRKLPGHTEYQYYVHYQNYDRRLDEWVDPDRIDSEEIQEEIASTGKSPNDITTAPNDDRKVTRNMKRKLDEMKIHKLSEIDTKFESLEREREEITKIRNIDKLHFGKYLMKTWYFSPYPDEYKELSSLYVCEFCLKYMRLPESLVQHKPCKFRRPPGRVIYEKDTLRVYEVDGKEDKLYCQNLSLLSKLFLDHKTVFFDIEPFMFFILTETEKLRNREFDHIVGYFSKEKFSYDDYNLACILTLPPHQRKGYGRFLIEFSYELSKLDGKVGSPERPLSDLGLAGYRSYWQAVLLDILRQNARDEYPTIAELSALTAIRQEDIVATLSSMNMIRYLKGDNIICVTPSMISDYIQYNAVKLERSVDPSCITYTPRRHVTPDQQVVKKRS